ncbi:general receptor for phosphoinositides 1-associated scaffold protein-like [Asterias rubens]|uniref:general receptor for phosphoinositides 1-associated scaffold protein-like n=1 Tax=Asterias rubens TaxID=7604 RepID=UPI001455B73D|nr:general receptor for phosphoinositides 1-associated scaffold protein-like [Asterias rubens]
MISTSEYAIGRYNIPQFNMRTLDRKKPKLAKKEIFLPDLGEVAHAVEQDRDIFTNEKENPRRRTIIIEKLRGSFGFELQTYAIHHRGSNEVEVCTYVCDVLSDGAAYLAGMRPGDIILSVNGINVEGAKHHQIVELIKISSNSLRLVVLFEDCVRKVELNKKLVKLKRTLYDKKLACRALQAQEKRILHGMDRYDRGLTPSHSQDSGICSPSSLLCPNQSSLNYSSKSQSMSSLSSGGFSLSMIPGNESLEEISILDI